MKIEEQIKVAEKAIVSIYGYYNPLTNGKTRKGELMEHRHLVRYLLAKCTSYGNSLSYIGINFTMSDHSTVINSIHRVEDVLSTQSHRDERVARFNDVIATFKHLMANPVLSDEEQKELDESKQISDLFSYKKSISRIIGKYNDGLISSKMLISKLQLINE